MSTSSNPAAAADIPDFTALAADPEIAALLDFEPVVRKVKRPDGWTAELQRELIARLAATGNLQSAVWQMGKHASGAEALYKVPGADAFRVAWGAAIALGRRRNGLDCRAPFDGEVPDITRRTNSRSRPTIESLPGRRGIPLADPETDDALEDLRDQARRSIANKLLRIRRLFLQDISASPGKRAAFEILTELPIDWDLAAQGKAQPDEPYNPANQHQPDMVLTAESGWSFGDCGYGPARQAELRAEIDAWRAERGMAPVDWSESESAESKTNGGEAGASA